MRMSLEQTDGDSSRSSCGTPGLLRQRLHSGRAWQTRAIFVFSDKPTSLNCLERLPTGRGHGNFEMVLLPSGPRSKEPSLKCSTTFIKSFNELLVPGGLQGLRFELLGEWVIL